MNYYLYKLKFTTALHIGNDSGRDNLASSEYTIHSDTIFSALCIEAMHYGEKTLHQLVQTFYNGQAVLSDAFPFRKDEYFLPKPAYRNQFTHPLSDPRDRKLFKKLAYIPLSMFQEYLHTSDDKPFDIHKAVSLQKDIVFEDKRQCVAIAGQEETRPFFVGNVEFNTNCGLYLIVGAADDAGKSTLEDLLVSLSYSGIGGKRNTGFGKFVLQGPSGGAESEEQQLHALQTMLTKEDADIYMTLNTSLPEEQMREEVLTDAGFSLCRRGGFVQSTSYSDKPLKKRTVYALSAGACLKKTYQGEFLDLAEGGSHPVYHCLTPLFAGVNI